MLYILYIIAITAEAMTASLSAGRRDMDWIGVLIISWITALGGGTIRNVLLGHYPMNWVEHPEYLLIVAIAAIFTAFIAKFMNRLKKLFLLLDAVGLVVFTIIGCQVAQDMSMPIVIIMLSGMITGCAGGIMRDVLCNDIPLIFQKEIYASAALITGGVYVTISHFFGNEFHYAIFVAFIVGLAIRLCALKYDWQMPKFVYRDEWY
ncbi:trimeric intracellular cation channel family protein [Parapedobacter tibetensis]|uniref:trimeric intracellular cation channel family protein n=1 Tax=Parapedobacter tibetensis TaxID=2972951 RepID=UPI00214DAEB3|nr:trimeric intracellular cation channel family protein [Parapedobacter tibetensis]